MIENFSKFDSKVICKCGESAILTPPRFYWKVVSGEDLVFRCPHCYLECLDCNCKEGASPLSKPQKEHSLSCVCKRRCYTHRFDNSKTNEMGLCGSCSEDCLEEGESK